MGCIVRRGNRYAVVQYAGRDPVTRKERRKWISFGTLREAQQYQAQCALNPVFGAGLGPNGTTRLRVGDWLDQWQDDVKRRIRPKTEEFYAYHLAALKEELGHLAVVRLTPQRIDALCKKMQDRGLSRSTVRGRYMVLHAALKHAVRKGVIMTNPCDLAEIPLKEDRRQHVWSPQQTRVFLQEARGSSRYYEVYATALATGMRIGEVLGLTWANVDLDAAVIHVRQTLEEAGCKRLRFGKPKTKRSARAVKISAVLVEDLRRLRKRQVEQRLRRGADYQAYDLVFADARGKPLHLTTIRGRDFFPVITRLGLPRIRLHDLRHCHATFLIGQGVDLRTVADRLGHSNPSVTLDIYSHLLSGTQDRAAEIANGLLTEPAEATQ